MEIEKKGKARNKTEINSCQKVHFHFTPVIFYKNISLFFIKATSVLRIILFVKNLQNINIYGCDIDLSL